MQDTLAEQPSESPAPGDDLTGQVLDGRYELVSRLGSGGMGIVYAARHVVLGSRLAVKVLRPPSADHVDEAMERFRREARAASALGHPHIVDVRDFGTLPGGLSYYVMEQLEGHDLLAEIERTDGLPAGRVAYIGRQIAEALGAAHAQSIVHRDLKPENVFLTTKNGQADHVKLIDFGIAKVSTTEAGMAKTLRPSAIAGMGMVVLAQSSSGGRFTAAGIVLGTPAYMSPEQCAGRDVDSRSDLYALGVLLFEAATGKIPFDAENVFDMMRQHQHSPAPDPRSHRPDLPAELAALILHCLEKDPAKRPMGMDEIAERLAMLAPPTPAREPSGILRAPSNLPKPPARMSGPQFAPAAIPATQLNVAARPARSSGPNPVRASNARWLGAAAVVVASAVLIGVALSQWGAPGEVPASNVGTTAVTARMPAPTSVATTPPSAPAPSPAPAPPPPAVPAEATETVGASAPPARPTTALAHPRHGRPRAETASPDESDERAPAAAVEAATPPPPAPVRPRPVDAVRDPWAN